MKPIEVCGALMCLYALLSWPVCLSSYVWSHARALMCVLSHVFCLTLPVRGASCGDVLVVAPFRLTFVSLNNDMFVRPAHS